MIGSLNCILFFSLESPFCHSRVSIDTFSISALSCQSGLRDVEVYGYSSPSVIEQVLFISKQYLREVRSLELGFTNGKKIEL